MAALAALPLERPHARGAARCLGRRGDSAREHRRTDRHPQQRASRQVGARRGRRGDARARDVHDRALSERGAVRARARRRAAHRRAAAAQEGPDRDVRRHRRRAAAGSARAGKGDLGTAGRAQPGVLAEHPRERRPASPSRRTSARGCPRDTWRACLATRTGTSCSASTIPTSTRSWPTRGTRRRGAGITSRT